MTHLSAETMAPTSEQLEELYAEQKALISVSDKTGIEYFASGLVELGYGIVSTGGTASKLREAGIAVTDVASVTGYPEMLDGRVKTLHPAVHAGILANTTKASHVATLLQNNINFFGVVDVNLYPFEATVASGASAEEINENIDIGGPTMLNAAAKARRVVVSSASQREPILEWLNAGKPDEEAFLKELAAEAYYETARYYNGISRYLGGTSVTGFIAKLESKTKYGENPQQAEAGFYADNRINIDPLGLDQFVHVQGMERSYVNMTDVDRLLQTATHIAAGFERNFGKVQPTAVGVKHGNASNAAVAETHVEAAEKMIESDTRAIFGGVVMINGEINKEVAEALMKHAMEGETSRLLDGVVGSSVTEEALELLNRKKLRVIVNPALANLSEASLDTSRRFRYVRGGVLEQPNYTFVQDLSAEYMQQHGEVTKQQKRDLILAWAVGSTSNSNTITLVKDGMLIGNGVGQQDRVGAGQLALTRTTIEIPTIEDHGDSLVLSTRLDAFKLEGAVAYSDSFFPFPDGPMLLAEAGIKAILTSSGSIADKAVITALNAKGVSVIMVPDKIGRGFYAH
ncbi:MAG TPA: bifunctional phosphoribosylaminoimidazolecarboxamide formyltransferase/IMP cyclohydrolase [Candidatus Binatia bacterium]|nr:bifunctional phosphoribosylaminoimidazolecarboxamide formyltransferase/IMP cyclohydrolase [Candidatus Binatia bacterium]